MAICGDGKVQGDEECDDNNSVDADGCEADCTLPKCDNGIVDPGEVCFVSDAAVIETGNNSLVDLVMADCNGDQILDALVLNSTDIQLTALLHGGSGPFTDRLDSSAITFAASSMTVGEFDGNSATTDLAVGHNGKFNVLKGDGACGFSLLTGRPTKGPSSDIVAFNLDGVGQDDVAISFQDSNSVGYVSHWVLGGGAPVEMGAAGTPVALVAAKLDGDELDDLAYIVDQGTTIFIRYNYGGGFLSPSKIDVSANPVALASADLNGDDKADLMSLNASGVTVAVKMGAGFLVKPPASVGVSSGTFEPSALATADVDGDGDLDVVTANVGSTSILLNDGSGNLSLASGFPLVLPQPATRVATTDVDGDGTADLVFSTSNGKLLLLGQSP